MLVLVINVNLLTFNYTLSSYRTAINFSTSLKLNGNSN